MARARQSHEVTMQRRQLAAYISAEPAEIVLRRPALLHDGAGGKSKSWELADGAIDLKPQIFRLVPFVRRLSQMTQDTPDGEVLRSMYSIVGRHDVDAQRYDRFKWEDQLHTLMSVEPNTTYRQAWVTVLYGYDHGDSAL